MTIFVVDIWHAEIIIQSVVVITIKIIKSTAYWGSSPVAVVSRKCRRMEVAGSWWSRHALISSRTMRTSCLSTRASLSTSHARRKVDGGREALTAKPDGSLAITSERSSHVVSGQSKILSCIVRNNKTGFPFSFFSRETDFSESGKRTWCSSVD